MMRVQVLSEQASAGTFCRITGTLVSFDETTNWWRGKESGTG